MTALKGAGLAIAALVVVALIAIGGWQLNWWMRGETVNRTAEINQTSYARQNALVEGILDDISEAEGSIPAAQRTAIVDQICDSAAKLTGSIQLPTSALVFIAQECPA